MVPFSELTQEESYPIPYLPQSMCFFYENTHSVTISKYLGRTSLPPSNNENEDGGFADNSDDDDVENGH
jgi:hypothetical protein